MAPANELIFKLLNALFRLTNISGATKGYIFSKPIADFKVTSPRSGAGFWGVLGPQKSKFLEIAASKHIAEPGISRTYPNLVNTSCEVQHLSFNDNSGLDKVHLSARYESYSYKGQLEASDDVNSVKNYITGANNYNQNPENAASDTTVEKVLSLFDLQHLQTKWVNSLSNGQMRRARIAKALVSQPKLLVIDDPFLGLDPKATLSVSKSLERFARDANLSIIIGLRAQDDVPSWVDHLAYVNETGIVILGEKKSTIESIRSKQDGQSNSFMNMPSLRQLLKANARELLISDPIIEFENASVVYRGTPILKGFNWGIERGSKWRILGDNGTGKTTLLSLITADHPQSWKSVIKINGVLRKSGSGISYFDINNRIGITSPEIHALVPPTMLMLNVILNGLVFDVGNANFRFQYKSGDARLEDIPETMLSEFSEYLEEYSSTSFGSLTISQQKLALFLRAAIKEPELLILDEAFSCMDDNNLVLRCHNYVQHLMPSVTVLSIGHIDWEVPYTDFTLQLLGGEECGYVFHKNSNKGI